MGDCVDGYLNARERAIFASLEIRADHPRRFPLFRIDRALRGTDTRYGSEGLGVLLKITSPWPLATVAKGFDCLHFHTAIAAATNPSITPYWYFDMPGSRATGMPSEQPGWPLLDDLMQGSVPEAQ